MDGLLCTFTFSLLQGSPIYGSLIGLWAVGMAGGCAHVCVHLPLTLVPLCRWQQPICACVGRQHRHQYHMGASSLFAPVHGCQRPVCSCTPVLVACLLMHTVASGPLVHACGRYCRRHVRVHLLHVCVGLCAGAFPPSQKGWGALVYYLYSANLPCHFWSMYMSMSRLSCGVMAYLLFCVVEHCFMISKEINVVLKFTALYSIGKKV